MQLQYAAENLTPIPAEHFLARKATDLTALKNSAQGQRRRRDAQHPREPRRKSDPGADQRLVVRRRFQRAGVQALVGRRPRSCSRKKATFLIPTKKNDPIELRDAPVSRADELLTFFNQARAAEGAGRRARPDHQAASRIQGAGKTTPAAPRRDRGNRAPQPAAQSRDGFRASSSAATISSSANRNCAAPIPISPSSV